jgi:hypothetical protein
MRVEQRRRHHADRHANRAGSQDDRDELGIPEALDSALRRSLARSHRRVHRRHENWSRSRCVPARDVADFAGVAACRACPGRHTGCLAASYWQTPTSGSTKNGRPPTHVWLAAHAFPASALADPVWHSTTGWMSQNSELEHESLPEQQYRWHV